MVYFHIDKDIYKNDGGLRVASGHSPVPTSHSMFNGQNDARGAAVGLQSRRAKYTYLNI